jgi:hypothetical protein
MKEFIQSFKIMKTARFFFFVGIVFLMTSCSVGGNPDPRFDEEYNDSWVDSYSVDLLEQTSVISPPQIIGENDQYRSDSNKSFLGPFQITEQTQGGNCVSECTSLIPLQISGPDENYECFWRCFGPKPFKINGFNDEEYQCGTTCSGSAPIEKMSGQTEEYECKLSCTKRE